LPALATAAFSALSPASIGPFLMIRTPLMNVMTAAAIKAGKGLKRDFAEIPSLQVSKKGPGDFVSEADKRAENILHRQVSPLPDRSA
jgi:hypothetical protein